MRCFPAVLFILLLTAGVLQATEALEICTYNIKWLGYSTTRDNETLSRVLSSFDLVAIQEIVAPPYPGEFPSGEPYEPDTEVAAFFDEMMARGFEPLLSAEDTGSQPTNGDNSSRTEWFAVFYNPAILVPVPDLPMAYIEADVTGNPVFDRVPCSFSLRYLKTGFDFVLVSVHLHSGNGPRDREVRAEELARIEEWIEVQTTGEQHYMVVGDMNFSSCEEICDSAPMSLRYLDPEKDGRCLDSSASPSEDHPYDFAFFTEAISVDEDFGIRALDLFHGLAAIWDPYEFSSQPAYSISEFADQYSDHNPVFFRILVPSADQD